MRSRQGRGLDKRPMGMGIWIWKSKMELKRKGQEITSTSASCFILLSRGYSRRGTDHTSDKEEAQW
jgi:hypothetical protein